MKVLVVNSGSSSIKYSLFDVGTATLLAFGAVEGLGEPNGRLVRHVRNAAGGFDDIVDPRPAPDHREGFARLAAAAAGSPVLRDVSELFGIGHRVVHGGEVFREPTLIDARVVAAIREMIPLAPLHNAANVMGIEVALEHVPRVPQVAVFDTAFHQSMPPHAYLYALPRELHARYRVRRYGFHGTSHQYVARKAAALLARPLEALNLITLHLGNGASACAIEAGRSVDTSMGLTPLEGLVMGTRCGDLDPAIHFYLRRVMDVSDEELESILNERSGLKGLCGTGDMREVLRRADAGEGPATLALDLFCYRIRKYVGAYYAALGRVDALVFTGGIGEHAAEVRRRALEGLGRLGITLDEARNRQAARGAREIQGEGAAVRVLVIPTDEELEIAAQTVACVRASGRA